MRIVTRLAAAAAVAALGLAPARAQETRAGAIAKRQAEKAAHLHAYAPNRGERIAVKMERALSNPPGVYAWFGNIYRGGLLALGPGYRTRFRGSGTFDAHAAVSLYNYKTVATSVQLPELARGRLRLSGDASWIDAPHVAFYGIGNDTPKEGKVRFVYRPTSAGLGAEARVAGPLSVGGSTGYLRVESDASSRDPFGSGAALFDTTPSWVRASVLARLELRPSPLYSRRGTMLRAEWSDYAQQAGSGSSFRQFEAEASQLIPILRENWIIALHARMTTTDTAAGEEVPFYLLPSIGGGSSLRGYHSWRFRDRNALALNAEYRWTPSHYLDMALFFDAGKVTARRADLDLNDMHTGYGIGARFHAPAAMVLRVDLGVSPEGVVLHWSASHRF